MIPRVALPTPTQKKRNNVDFWSKEKFSLDISISIEMQSVFLKKKKPDLSGLK